MQAHPFFAGIDWAKLQQVALRATTWSSARAADMNNGSVAAKDQELEGDASRVPAFNQTFLVENDHHDADGDVDAGTPPAPFVF